MLGYVLWQPPGSPVELETVSATDAEQEFLGFDVQVLQASISVLLCDEPWKVRTCNSAGVRAQKLAAYFSKRYNILRYTWRMPCLHATTCMPACMPRLHADCTPTARSCTPCAGAARPTLHAPPACCLRSPTARRPARSCTPCAGVGHSTACVPTARRLHAAAPPAPTLATARPFIELGPLIAKAIWGNSTGLLSTGKS